MIARSLPTAKSPRFNTVVEEAISSSRRHNLKRKYDGKGNDKDTPRAFSRIMAFKAGVKPYHGLDNGGGVRERQRQDAVIDVPSGSISLSEQNESPAKIMPGERMADFSARVDNALPVIGLVRKGRGKDLPGVKHRQTKLEKKMQRMQKEWRETDARWKQRLKEEREEAEEQSAEHEVMTGLWKMDGKRNNQKMSQEIGDGNPWARIAKSREEQATTRLVGLHDVVRAPPSFTRLPKERFKARNGVSAGYFNALGTARSLR